MILVYQYEYCFTLDSLAPPGSFPVLLLYVVVGRYNNPTKSYLSCLRSASGSQQVHYIRRRVFDYTHILYNTRSCRPSRPPPDLPITLYIGYYTVVPYIRKVIVNRPCSRNPKGRTAHLSARTFSEPGLTLTRALGPKLPTQNIDLDCVFHMVQLSAGKMCNPRTRLLIILSTSFEA